MIHFIRPWRLDSATKAKYIANDFSQVTGAVYKLLALVRHELTHWADHVITLWDRNISCFYLIQ